MTQAVGVRPSGTSRPFRRAAYSARLFPDSSGAHGPPTGCSHIRSADRLAHRASVTHGFGRPLICVPSLGRVCGAHGQKIVIGGIVAAINRRVNKKGQPWAIVEIADLDAATEMFVFSATYTNFQHVLIEDSVLLVATNVNIREGRISIVAGDISSPDLGNGGPSSAPVTLTLPVHACTRPNIEALRDVLRSHPGGHRCAHCAGRQFDGAVGNGSAVPGPQESRPIRRSQGLVRSQLPDSSCRCSEFVDRVSGLSAGSSSTTPI